MSCLVRGFWGDITVSPYPTLSLEVEEYPENERLFEKRNETYVHVGWLDVSGANMWQNTMYMQ